MRRPCEGVKEKMKKGVKKQDKKAWAIAIGAAGVTLLAQGLIELVAYLAIGDWFNKADLIRWITPIVFSVILLSLAFKDMPELKDM
jgi:hypothetical protein